MNVYKRLSVVSFLLAFSVGTLGLLSDFSPEHLQGNVFRYVNPCKKTIYVFPGQTGNLHGHSVRVEEGADDTLELYVDGKVRAENPITLSDKVLISFDTNMMNTFSGKKIPITGDKCESLKRVHASCGAVAGDTSRLSLAGFKNSGGLCSEESTVDNVRLTGSSGAQKYRWACLSDNGLDAECYAKKANEDCPLGEVFDEELLKCEKCNPTKPSDSKYIEGGEACAFECLEGFDRSGDVCVLPPAEYVPTVTTIQPLVTTTKTTTSTTAAVVIAPESDPKCSVLAGICEIGESLNHNFTHKMDAQDEQSLEELQLQHDASTDALERLALREAIEDIEALYEGTVNTGTFGGTNPPVKLMKKHLTWDCITDNESLSCSRLDVGEQDNFQDPGEDFDRFTAEEYAVQKAAQDAYQLELENDAFLNANTASCGSLNGQTISQEVLKSWRISSVGLLSSDALCGEDSRAVWSLSNAGLSNALNQDATEFKWRCVSRDLTLFYEANSYTADFGGSVSCGASVGDLIPGDGICGGNRYQNMQLPNFFIQGEPPLTEPAVLCNNGVSGTNVRIETTFGGSAEQVKWSCPGYNGGSTAQCSRGYIKKPYVNPANCGTPSGTRNLTRAEACLNGSLFAGSYDINDRDVVHLTWYGGPLDGIMFYHWTCGGQQCLREYSNQNVSTPVN